MARQASSKPADSTAIRGIEADFGPDHADTFSPDLQPFGESIASHLFQAS